MKSINQELFLVYRLILRFRGCMLLDRTQRQVDIRVIISLLLLFVCLLLVGIYGDMNGELVAVLHGHKGGVTHIRYSSDGNRLYSGARKV